MARNFPRAVTKTENIDCKSLKIADRQRNVKKNKVQSAAQQSHSAVADVAEGVMDGPGRGRVTCHVINLPTGTQLTLIW